MKQYGDITQLKGYELDPVDLIVGGSPCQDLSVAGKRAGLEGERSGLFMEMIRIIKEMRNATNFVRPRYALWENVPGAFSSNGGGDFAAVLTEFARIAEPTVPDVPTPKKWTKSGVILGNGWSLAWRTHDAQFWGVPQRRKRISVVVDFRGDTAPKILFERKSMPRDHKPGGQKGEESSGTAEDGPGTAGKGKCLNPWNVQSKRIQPMNGIADTLYSGERSWDGGQSYVFEDKTTVYGIDLQGGKGGANYTVDVAPTLASDSHGTPHAISFQERSGKPGGGRGY